MKEPKFDFCQKHLTTINLKQKALHLVFKKYELSVEYSEKEKWSNMCHLTEENWVGASCLVANVSKLRGKWAKCMGMRLLPQPFCSLGLCAAPKNQRNTLGVLITAGVWIENILH